MIVMDVFILLNIYCLCFSILFNFDFGVDVLKLILNLFRRVCIWNFVVVFDFCIFFVFVMFLYLE